MKQFISIALIFLVTASVGGSETSFAIKKAELNCQVSDNKPKADSVILEFDKSFRSVLQDIEGAWEFVKENRPANDLVAWCKNPPPGNEVWKKYSSDFCLLKDLVTPEHYYVLEVDSGRIFQFSSAGDLISGEVDKILNLASVPESPTFQNTVKLKINNANNLDLTKNLALIAKFTDSKKTTPTMVQIEKASNCELLEDQLPEPESNKKNDSDESKQMDLVKFAKQIKQNDNKDNSVWDFEFALAGGKSKKSVYSFKSEFRPFQRRRFGLGGHYDWTYFFMDTEVKFNSGEGDRKNVLNLGTEFSLTRVFHKDGNRFQTVKDSQSRFPGLTLSYSPKLETEWGFKERNIVPVNFRGTLPINIYQSRRTTVRLDPYAGFESGYVWRSENSKPGWNIARPFVGADFTFGFLRREKTYLGDLKISYIRRFLIKPELSYGLVGSDEVPDGLSRRPRDHATAKFTLNAGPFSPFLEYEYGRVPPRYVFQNHTLKSGITLNVDFFWKKNQ